jgi:hypothetical protein
MFFSTKGAASPTIANLGSVSILLPFEALGYGTVLSEELTVLELPIM